MITKILSIENVGRIECQKTASPPFGQLTVIYGENGHGKSTLAALFRSLSTGDSVHLLERKTLGQSHAPKVKLLIDGNQVVTFDSGKWSRKGPEVEIYDATFVNENVYTGESVGADHRKRLYDIVLGAAGVQAAARIDALDEGIRNVGREISDLEQLIKTKAIGAVELDTFLGLEHDEEVRIKLDGLEARKYAVTRQAGIKQWPRLKSLSAPETLSGVIDLLQVSVSRIADDARAMVEEHFRVHAMPGGEDWVRRGLRSATDTCPFCGQELHGSRVYSSFAEYFSREYEQLTERLQQKLEELEALFGDRAFDELKAVVAHNRAVLQQWEGTVTLDSPVADLESLERTWCRYRAELGSALRRKLANPTRAHSGDVVCQAAQAVDESHASLGGHNGSVARGNSAIEFYLRGLSGASADEIEAEMRHLQNVEVRHGDDVRRLCSELQAKRAERDELRADKTAARDRLERDSKVLLTKYEGALNRFLKGLGARFQVTGTGLAIRGGKASTEYKIKLKGGAVDVGERSGGRSAPSFRTVLSTGDRTTLALAFFLAKLDVDSALSQKVVVLDDPISSLDMFRATWTRQKITDLAGKAKQVIVMSHDPQLLYELTESGSSQAAQAMCITPKGDATELESWDAERHCAHPTVRDHFLLWGYREGRSDASMEPTMVAQRIRPFVEAHLRFRHPVEFRGRTMVGNMLRLIETAAPGSAVEYLQASLDDLRALNAFSVGLHHQGATYRDVSVEEVRAMVDAAFRVVHHRDASA